MEPRKTLSRKNTEPKRLSRTSQDFGSSNEKRLSKKISSSNIPLPTVDKTNKPKNDNNYTDNEIHEMLIDGYFYVPKELWSFIPRKSHIRYFIAGNSPRNERFRVGGFVKNHFTTSDKKMMTIESHRNIKEDQKYVSFPLAYDDVDEIWKKYESHAYVEIHMLNQSLAVKNKRLEKLEAQNKSLNDRLTMLENILRNAVIK